MKVDFSKGKQGVVYYCKKENDHIDMAVGIVIPYTPEGYAVVKTESGKYVFIPEDRVYCIEIEGEDI